MTRRAPLVIAALALATVTGLAPAHGQAPEQPEPPAPYADPPFECDVIDYGTEAPPQSSEEDPLCVRYDKTNITVEMLEFVDFLEGEPTRITMVAGKCSYWQQDHWIVRLTPDSTPIVEWEGSYWYDARTGTGAGILRGLKVGGEPVDGTAFIEAIRPWVGDEQADEMALYTDEEGGGGAMFATPEGFAYAECGGPAEDEEEAAPSGSGGSEVSDGSASGASVAGASVARSLPAASTSLPATGGEVPLAGAAAALAGAAGLARLVRRSA